MVGQRFPFLCDIGANSYVAMCSYPVRARSGQCGSCILSMMWASLTFTWGWWAAGWGEGHYSGVGRRRERVKFSNDVYMLRVRLPHIFVERIGEKPKEHEVQVSAAMVSLLCWYMLANHTRGIPGTGTVVCDTDNWYWFSEVQWCQQISSALYTE